MDIDKPMKSLTYTWVMTYFVLFPERLKEMKTKSPEEFMQNMMFMFGKLARDSMREVIEDLFQKKEEYVG